MPSRNLVLAIGAVLALPLIFAAAGGSRAAGIGIGVLLVVVGVGYGAVDRLRERR